MTSGSGGGPCHVLNVVGARPNFMKLAPLHEAFLDRPGYRSSILHTGQHYDDRMNRVFFEELELPEPDVYLGVGSASHGRQTAAIMEGFEDVLDEEPPDLVIVVGDVNSTVACSLVAAKRHVPVAHVEAGLRSFDRRMPEELNRIVTDQLSDFLFVTEESGVFNLANEGVPSERVFFVGNVMIDTLVRFRERARDRAMASELGLEAGRYVVTTLHRPSNVDDPETLERLVEVLEDLGRRRTTVFPVHPRTDGRLSEFGLRERLASAEGVRLIEPLGYLDFLGLMEDAALVLTDSGGIQEETTFLGVPCLTLRDSTERPVTVRMGTNELLPLDPDRIRERVEARLGDEGAGAAGGARSDADGDRGEPERPPLWDGRAAERIVHVLDEHFPG